MTTARAIFGTHAAAANFSRWKYWLTRRVFVRLAMRREFCGVLCDEVDAGYCLDSRIP